MNKGMFYCLPFLALTQVAASNAVPHRNARLLKGRNLKLIKRR